MKVLVVLSSVVVAAGKLQDKSKIWPDCIVKGKILRNNETNAVFADIRPLGASKGCWQDNCGSSDKTQVGSLDHCAATCAKVPECNFWTFDAEDNLCYFQISSCVWIGVTEDTADDLESAVFAPRACAPPNTIFTVDIPHAQAALMAAQNEDLLKCAENVEACEDKFGAMATFAYILQQFKQALLKAGRETLQEFDEPSRFADNALAELNMVLAKDQPPKDEVQIVMHNAITLIMEVSEWLAAQPIVEVDRNDLSLPLPILGYFCQRHTCYPPAELTAMPEFLALMQPQEEVKYV